jgi:hypothetical protein
VTASAAVTLTFSREEAEGLAELLEVQYFDAGFLILAKEIRDALAAIDAKEARS